MSVLCLFGDRIGDRGRGGGDMGSPAAGGIGSGLADSVGGDFILFKAAGWDRFGDTGGEDWVGVVAPRAPNATGTKLGSTLSLGDSTCFIDST